MKKIERILSIVVAIILLQTLFFKFSGAAESVAIFSALGVEPWGRYLTGFLELLAAVALLKSSCVAKGAILSILIMVGALLSHIFVLGFAGDNLSLSLMAVFVLVASVAVLILRRINK